MMGPGEVMIALIVIGLPVLTIFYGFHRFFKYRERQLEIEAMQTAEKAAQYAARTVEVEQRLRVLEQIVTDGGMQTAAQIEALRDRKQLSQGEQAK